MEWKREKTSCPECAVSHRKASKPNTFSKAITTLRRHSRIAPHNLAASFATEEKKARNAYQIKVARLRSIAIEHSRRNTFG